MLGAKDVVFDIVMDFVGISATINAASEFLRSPFSSAQVIDGPKSMLSKTMAELYW